VTCSCCARAVGEYSVLLWRSVVRRSGAYGSKNVGTSNRNAGEIPARRKTKVSLAMLISQGLVGPKVMAKAETDGHMVNIPWLQRGAMGGRSLVCFAHYWICVRARRKVSRKIRYLLLMAIPTRAKILSVRGKEIKQSRLPRKTSKHNRGGTVPQTDTGSLVEKTKANEWFFPKELGKKAAVTSE